MIRLATRKSPLAMWQARHVASLLRAAHPSLKVELVPVSTAGDRSREVPIWEIGGRGVFAGELQSAVLAGEVDAAVHSAKDLQPRERPGLCLAATPKRADPRDVLVGAHLAELGPGSVVATGSQRRRTQLAALRPGLQFTGLRGNIATRLQRVPPGGAIVVAMAALERLELRPEPMEVLGTDVMLPQVAQGAIAVECRESDEHTLGLLQCANDAQTRAAVEAERAFLAALGGGCDLPVAGYATLSTVGVEGGRSGEVLVLTGLLAAPDGSRLVRRQAVGAAEDPVGLGKKVAQAVLSCGGDELVPRTR